MTDIKSIASKVFSIVSGWFSAFFFLSFVGAIFILTFRLDPVRHSIFFAITGFIMQVVAFKVLNKDEDGEFFEHFMIAFSLSGQTLFLMSLYELFGEPRHYAFVVALYSAILTFIVKNKTHQFFTSAFATLSLHYLFVTYSFYLLIYPLLMALFVWIFLYHPKKYQSVAYGVILGTLFSLFTVSIPFGSIILSKRGMKDFFDAYMDHFMVKPWMANLLLGGILFYILYNIIKHYKIEELNSKVLIYLLGFAIMMANLFYYHSIMIPSIMITLGVFIRQKPLWMLGILSLVGFLSRFYYIQNTTLLEKSYTLFGSGVFMIAVWFYLKELQKGVKDA